MNHLYVNPQAFYINISSLRSEKNCPCYAVFKKRLQVNLIRFNLPQSLFIFYQHCLHKNIENVSSHWCICVREKIQSLLKRTDKSFLRWAWKGRHSPCGWCHGVQIHPHRSLDWPGPMTSASGGSRCTRQSVSHSDVYTDFSTSRYGQEERERKCWLATVLAWQENAGQSLGSTGCTV